MLIVNQDRDRIINFENMDEFYIENPLENIDGEFEIMAENEWINERIGCYKTESRAKEVLDDISKYYRGYDMKDNYSPAEAIARIEIRKRSVFYMPEE